MLDTFQNDFEVVCFHLAWLFIAIACIECSKLLRTYSRLFHSPELNLQNRVLYSIIVWGVWWSVKLILQGGMEKSHFCVRPWSLLTILNLSERGPTDTTVF